MQSLPNVDAAASPSRCRSARNVSPHSRHVELRQAHPRNPCSRMVLQPDQLSVRINQVLSRLAAVVDDNVSPRVTMSFNRVLVARVRPAHGRLPPRAHPRTRGERSSMTLKSDRSMGSSPHARGAPVPQHVVVARAGLIPARAGSTPRRRENGPDRRAHPRTCGEHSGTYQREQTYLGSSPHVRGARHAPVVVQVRQRLIPARSGSTCPRCWICAWRWGSSPHARGALMPARRIPSTSRLIPARAGSTWRVSPRSHPSWAHPRTRGEHSSSCSGVVHSRGLIPARAGSTLPDLHVSKPITHFSFTFRTPTGRAFPGGSVVPAGLAPAGTCAS